MSRITVRMKINKEEIRERLKSFDEKYEKDRTVSKKLEEYRKKYSVLTEQDLQKPFTI